jgi:hypothetical protein
MSDRVRSVSEALDLLVPPFDPTPEEWDQVLARAATGQPTEPIAGTPRRVPRRLFVPATAVILAVIAVASALAATGTNPLSDFTSWLSGKPGRPAPAAAQRQFRNSPGQHSWDAFPPSTNLRVLVSGESGGSRYVLYGFRSGNSLCLTLSIDARQYSYRPGCASASTLSHLSAPILPMGTGWVSDSFIAPTPQIALRPTAQIAIGIVSDDVTTVSVNATDGRHSAWVGGDAYLWVEDHPNSGNSVISYTAVTRGHEVTVQAPPPPLFDGPGPPLAAPRGPSHLEATIASPGIGWLARHDPIGIASGNLSIAPVIKRLIAASGFTRFIKPDPLSNVIVGVSARRLFYNGGLWGGSNAPYFDRGPIHIFYPPEQSSQQFVTITGVAADGVSEIKFFLSDGEIQIAALKDNVFTGLIPRSAPVRIVAYNPAGLVVGIETVKHLTLLAGPTLPAAATRDLKPVLSVRGPEGGRSTLRVGKAIDNVRCWRAIFSSGHSQSGCEQLTPTSKGRVGTTAIRLLGGVQPVGRDVFVIAHVRPPVVRARLQFASGDSVTATPIDGFVVFAVPRDHLHTTQQQGVLRAYGRNGREITRVVYQDGRQTVTRPVLVPSQIKGQALRKLFLRRLARSRPTLYFHSAT